MPPAHTATEMIVALYAHRGGTEFDVVLTPGGFAIANLNGHTDDAIASLRGCKGIIRPQITIPAADVRKVG